MTTTNGSTALTGRHYIVTGAGSGIGRAIALRLAHDGAHLTLLGRRRAALDETVSMLGARTRVVVSSCDIRRRDEVVRSVRSGAEALGAVHGLVANAGIGGENHRGVGDRFDDIVATNIVGTYSCIRAVEEHLASGPAPRHIVVISSILARIGVPGYTGYCASKAGLLGLVRAFAAEFAAQQIQVNAICPGWVATDMAWQGIDTFAASAGQTRQQAFDDAMKPVPLKRMSEPSDIAAFVAYLLSPEARGITGQALDMNNGAWMG